ncbi:MAG: two-component regulator propeller domain-containing protein [Bacteroidia bacterium]
MKNLYFLIIFLLATTFSKAQVIAQVGDIIDNATVTAVDESDSHYWIGTNKGLYRVNKEGKDYVFYTTKNSAITSNKITSICCRKDGHVWIGTNEGITYYDNFAFTSINVENSKLPENNITSMKEDANGDLWIGTLNSGLVKVHYNKFEIFNQDNSTLANNSIHAIKLDQQNNLVVSVLQKDSATLTASNIVRK